MSRPFGYSLLELLVTLSIVMIILALAMPAFTATRDAVRGEQVATDLITALTLARSAAIQHDMLAIVCPETPEGHCGKSWESGYMVFLDEDSDLQPDPSETILQHLPAPPAGSSLTLRIFTNRQLVAYLPTGHLKNYTAASFTYCPPSQDARKARHIVINRIGRIRKGLDRNRNGIQEDSSGKDLTCP